MTVRRFRQIVAAIRRRQYMRRREEISLMTWQTRQLSTFVAAGYMTDGKGNPMLDAAQILSFDEIEKAQIEEATGSSSGSAHSNLEFDEKGDIVPLYVEPKQGSFESFMGSMGSPSSWR